MTAPSRRRRVLLAGSATAALALAGFATVFLPGSWGAKGSDVLTILAVLGAVVCVALTADERAEGGAGRTSGPPRRRSRWVWLAGTSAAFVLAALARLFLPGSWGAKVSDVFAILAAGQAISGILSSRRAATARSG